MSPPDRTCPGCGGRVAADSRYCPTCGASVERLVPGQILDGRYEILDKIGEGGMGEVYRARHIHLDEIRIIKVTKPDALSEGPEPRRFQEEARMATLVRHPNVAALYDFARQPDGSYYMAWEFIDGVTLQQRLSRHGPLPLRQALDVARQVLAGLREIHRQGIVHRDVSPDNIMLRELPDGSLQAKIIDLGIAKRLAAVTSQMTNTGIFLGKLKYASPEQAGSLPAGQTIDGRSDLYSLGAVLYEMLTGKPPFEGKTPQEYIGKHLHQAPPPLDTSRLPPDVGPAVTAVVQKALEKNRERRFRDASDFESALASLESPATAPTALFPSAAAAAPPTVPRRGNAIRVIAAVLVLGLGAGVWALAHHHRPGVRRAAASKVTHAPPTAPAAPSPTEAPVSSSTAPLAAAPTEAAEAVSPSQTPRPKNTPLPKKAPLPTKTSVPAVTPASAPAPLTAPGNAQARRQRVQRWKDHPIDERARRARELARWANFVAAQHPNAPDVQQLKIDLPALLRQETLDALAQRRPFLARLFHQAYLSLDFAPADPDLARRVNAAPVPPRHTPN